MVPYMSLFTSLVLKFFTGIEILYFFILKFYVLYFGRSECLVKEKTFEVSCRDVHSFTTSKVYV